MFRLFGFTAVVVLLMLSAVHAQEPDIEKIKEQIANHLPEGVLPGGLNINTTALPSQDDVVKVLKQKCEKTSGNAETYKGVEEAALEMKDCVGNLVDIEKLQEEIEAAQPNGELDTVFNKYCRKRTIAIECMNNFTIKMEPCLDAEEIAHKKTFVNIFTNLLNFVCHKEGDQIALFIAEKGPECFKSKQDALSVCFNSTFGNYAVPNVTLETLPHLVMGAEQCSDMTKLQHCVVNELESCDESTPANLVDAMFKFVRNETPCVNMTASPRVQLNNHASNQLYIPAFTLATTLAMTMLSKLLL